MPVPKSTVDNSPRKLLRDVVLEKMLAAIQDGTLQAGERLNDDELVAWLGVSRTPIREAIAKLVDYGLVEMEANRYTRVASPTREQYDDAFQLLFGFAELAARWAVPNLDDAAVKSSASSSTRPASAPTPRTEGLRDPRRAHRVPRRAHRQRAHQDRRVAHRPHPVRHAHRAAVRVLGRRLGHRHPRSGEGPRRRGRRSGDPQHVARMALLRAANASA